MSFERTIVFSSGVGGSPEEWDAIRTPISVFGHVATTIPTRGSLILIGHSEGGVQALRVATTHSDRVEAVVLASCFFPPARGGRSLGVTVADYGRHRLLYIRDLVTRRGRPSPSRHGIRQIASLARLGIRPAAFHHIARAVGCPVLVLHGDEDHIVPIEFARAAVVAHPTWTVRELPAAGHHPHRDEPGAWATAVTDWLGMVL